MVTTTAPPATTRPAASVDEEFLRALFASSRPFDLTGLSAVPGLLELQLEARRRAHAAAYPLLRDEIVLLEDRPVGRLLTARTTGATHVVDVAIAPEHRGQGLGGTLLGRLLDSGPVTLTVALANPARRLYDRLGFVPVGSTDTDLSLRHPGHDTKEPA